MKDFEVHDKAYKIYLFTLLMLLLLVGSAIGFFTDYKTGLNVMSIKWIALIILSIIVLKVFLSICIHRFKSGFITTILKVDKEGVETLLYGKLLWNDIKIVEKVKANGSVYIRFILADFFAYARNQDEVIMNRLLQLSDTKQHIDIDVSQAIEDVNDVIVSLNYNCGVIYEKSDNF